MGKLMALCVSTFILKTYRPKNNQPKSDQPLWVQEFIWHQCQVLLGNKYDGSQECSCLLEWNSDSLSSHLYKFQPQGFKIFFALVN